jgi:ribonuclease HI
MPWIRARLRGQLVFARADDAGRFVDEGGRVEIRYKADDGRLYRAMIRNLEVASPEVLPDSTCAAAGAVERPPAASQKDKPARRTASPEGHSAPPEEHHVASDPDVLDLWTDGACTGNPGPAGIGVLLRGRGRTLELSEYLGHGTNNIAELTAILRGLDLIDELVGPDAVRARIRTDSKYSIGVLQKGWKAKANVELIARIVGRLSKRRGVRLEYVPGHAGVSGNEHVDALAREAVRTRSSRRGGA